MQNEGFMVRDLDLMTGYRLERDGAGYNLVDPEGRRVARLSGHEVPEAAKIEKRSRLEEPVSDEEWRDLCRALLMLARSHLAECQILRERVSELSELLREAEEERDVTNRIAEDLYEFFSRTARRSARRKWRA